MGLIGSSGKGGATLHRRFFGEGLENLANSGEYHWMAGNYIKYCATESKTGAWTADMLPVDSHELIALCAPRLCAKIKHSNNSHFATPSIAIEI
jgi:hypothetical protein